MSQEIYAAASSAGGENPSFVAAGALAEDFGPASADGGIEAQAYDAVLPEGFPAEHVDQALLGRFKQFCGSAGLSPEQATKAVSFYMTEQNGLAEQMQERCEADLRAKWGSRYDEQLSKAKRTCLALDKRMGGRLMPLVNAGLGNHPAFGELMALLGRDMAEDSIGVAPGAAGVARRAFMPNTRIFNLTGQPAMSMPLAWTEAGLPVGVQFVARMGDEATLFRIAAQLEQAAPWAGRRPQIC